jgi:hypothetical protein
MHTSSISSALFCLAASEVLNSLGVRTSTGLLDLFCFSLIGFFYEEQQGHAPTVILIAKIKEYRTLQDRTMNS